VRMKGVVVGVVTCERKGNPSGKDHEPQYEENGHRADGPRGHERPIAGLIDLGQAVNLVAEGGANAVIGHVGLALHGHRQGGRDIGLILHLSASTMLAPDPNEKVLVNTVQNALKMGADAVSMHVNIGPSPRRPCSGTWGWWRWECMEWGMPLLAMMYPRARTSRGKRHRAGEAGGTGRGGARGRYCQDRVHRRPGELPRGNAGVPGAGGGGRRFKDR